MSETLGSSVIPIESFGIAISQRITLAIEERVARLAIVLTQLIQAEYERTFTVNDAGGAVSAVTYEITRTRQFLEVAFGATKANDYLKYLEFGVKGTQSTPPGGALYSRTKAPPLKNIYDWIRRAKLLVPRYYVDRAEANQKRKSKSDKPWYSVDPLTLFAYDVAQSIKRRGTPALHVIERVFTQQLARIQEAFTLG